MDSAQQNQQRQAAGRPESNAILENASRALTVKVRTHRSNAVEA